KSKSLKPQAEPSGITCEKCGGEMVFREGKFGKFLACSNFPSCKNTQALDQDAPQDLGVCPKCSSTIVIRHSKKGKTFYGCSKYPTFDFESWDMPLNTVCPQCSQALYKHITPKGEQIYCNNKECNYVKPKEEN
ncbi:MAG: topoisomerase DNA-binding C4 zinc finger domain-containing protein, partial [Clostridia bacterium]|nr:topoisomerase DNA-binding C4 zinc finger domain-containing protein [Clostridia bacterium]